MNAPSNLSEIRQAVASMFKNPAVVSVEIETFLGLVVVFRDGTIKSA